MDWRKRLGVVVLVVGLGLAIALQFRKPTGTFSSGPVSAENEAASGSAAVVKEPTTVSGPTSSATAFDGHIETAPSTVAMESAGTSSADEPAASEGNSSGPTTNKSLVDLNEPVQTHKIADGDTLTKLSQQYLGRPDRATDIFDNNRDVLSSPDMLPIGATLRMPSKLAAPGSTAGMNSVVATQPGAGQASSGAQKLVPVITPATTAKPAATTTQAASTQQAGTTQPGTAAQSPATQNDPHTYKVQPGDNLVDIARKVYGDGRRHTDLFEANRRTMRNPGDLKPGMVLVVP